MAVTLSETLCWPFTAEPATRPVPWGAEKDGLRLGCSSPRFPRIRMGVILLLPRLGNTTDRLAWNSHDPFQRGSIRDGRHETAPGREEIYPVSLNEME